MLWDQYSIFSTYLRNYLMMRKVTIEKRMTRMMRMTKKKMKMTMMKERRAEVAMRMKRLKKMNCCCLS